MYKENVKGVKTVLDGKETRVGAMSLIMTHTHSRCLMLRVTYAVQYQHFITYWMVYRLVIQGKYMSKDDAVSNIYKIDYEQK